MKKKCKMLIKNKGNTIFKFFIKNGNDNYYVNHIDIEKY